MDQPVDSLDPNDHSNYDERTRSRDEATADPSVGREIVIGPRYLVLPVLALAFVAGGWWLGRSLAARRIAEQPAVASQPVAQPIGDAGSLGVTGNEAMPFTIVPADQGNPGLGYTMDPGQVIPLQERYHPLMDQPAPTFSMRQLDTGAEVSLDQFAGQPVLINFWATWCPPCRAEMPWIENVYNEFKGQGLVVLAVDAGEKVPPSMVEDTVSRYIASSGLTFPVLLGDNTYDVQREYQVYGLPGTALVDRAGVFVAYHSGMYPNEATLRDQVERLLMAAGAAEAEGQPEG